MERFCEGFQAWGWGDNTLMGESNHLESKWGWHWSQTKTRRRQNAFPLRSNTSPSVLVTSNPPQDEKRHSTPWTNPIDRPTVLRAIRPASAGWRFSPGGQMGTESVSTRKPCLKVRKTFFPSDLKLCFEDSFIRTQDDSSYVGGRGIHR